MWFKTHSLHHYLHVTQSHFLNQKYRWLFLCLLILKSNSIWDHFCPNYLTSNSKTLLLDRENFVEIFSRSRCAKKVGECQNCNFNLVFEKTKLLKQNISATVSHLFCKQCLLEDLVAFPNVVIMHFESSCICSVKGRPIYTRRLANYKKNSISRARLFRKSLKSYLLRTHKIDIIDFKNAHLCDDCYNQENHFTLIWAKYSIPAYVQ